MIKISSKSDDRFLRYGFWPISSWSRERIFFKFCVVIECKKTDLLTLVLFARATRIRSYGCSKFWKNFKNFQNSKFFTFFGKLSLETMIFGIKNNFWNFSDFFFSKLVIRISVPDICSSKNKDWNIEKLIWVCYTNFSFWSKIISTISYNFHYKFDFQVIIYQKNQVLDLFLAIGCDVSKF